MAPSLSQFPGGLGPEAIPMSTRFFTNHGEQTLLRKFQGVFESNTDIEWSDALVGFLRASGYFAIRPFLGGRLPLGRCFVMTPDEIKVVEEAGK
jgi:hypothetical protein